MAKGLKTSSSTVVYKRHLQSQFGSVIYRRYLGVFFMFELKAAFIVAIWKRHLSVPFDNDNLLTAIWKRLL